MGLKLGEIMTQKENEIDVIREKLIPKENTEYRENMEHIDFTAIHKRTQGKQHKLKLKQ